MRRRVAVGGAGRRSWLASAATNPISSSRSSSVAARTAPSLWARIPNTSRSQSGSSNRNSRSATATSSAMTIWVTEPTRASRRRRRSKGESSQLLMIPSSPQTLHCHRIGAPGAVGVTIIRPRQRRLAGRRRHGSALSQLVAASPAVAARTMLLRCSARRRAGPGVSGGRSEEVVQVGNQHFSGLYRATVRRCAHTVPALAVAPFVRACVEADLATQAPNRSAPTRGEQTICKAAYRRHTDGGHDRHSKSGWWSARTTNHPAIVVIWSDAQQPWIHC